MGDRCKWGWSQTLIPRRDLVLKTKGPLFIGGFQIMILAGSCGSGLLFIKNIESGGLVGFYFIHVL